MPTRLNPYLSFQGNAREAMEFYNSVFGGELVANTYSEFGGADNPADADKIMHAQLEAEDGLALMGADAPTGQPFTPGTNYSVSLSGDDDAQLRGFWEKLSDGATIVEPLERAPWGDSFGMLVDKYGVSWLVNISGS